MSIEWKPIQSAPLDGSDVLCYFPLEGLSDDWERIVPVYWNDDQHRWVYSGRATRSYSHGFQPSHWSELNKPNLQT